MCYSIPCDLCPSHPCYDRLFAGVIGLFGAQIASVLSGTMAGVERRISLLLELKWKLGAKGWPSSGLPQVVLHDFPVSFREEKGPKFLVRIFSSGVGVFYVNGVGAKKFDTSLETREIKLFGRGIPGFCRDIPGVPEKFEKKVCVQFPFPIYSSRLLIYVICCGKRQGVDLD